MAFLNDVVTVPPPPTPHVTVSPSTPTLGGLKQPIFIISHESMNYLCTSSGLR